MDSSELIRKVRKIEIKTRGLSHQLFSGEYHSAFKGRGMAFSEVREYMPGDEIRTIDWHVTARFNHPYVKVFEEERELTVVLLVDVSASEEFGTRQQFKSELLTELCAVLSFSAIMNNDKIGVIFFSDRIEKFIPPKKGRSHILRIIRELLDFKPQSQKTDIAMALGYLANVIKKRSVVFILSDFIDKHFEDALKIANKKHDVVAIRLYDKTENSLPSVGLVPFRDAETGNVQWINTSSGRVRSSFRALAAEREKRLQESFRKCGVDYVDLATDESYVQPLINVFKQRERRR